MGPPIRALCAGALAGWLALSPTSAVAVQTVLGRTEEQVRASYEGHKGDFDYLLGDWQFTAVHREYGRSHGYWSAVRLTEGPQILDEYRVVGDSGQTVYVTRTLRAYNAVLDRWELVSTEEGAGLQDVGTGRKVGDEMHLEQTFGAMSPEPSQWRIRYYDIRPDRFSWTADRSVDGGQTWVSGYLRIEARRIGPARAMAPLTTGRKPAGGG